MGVNWGMIETAQRELSEVNRKEREAMHYRAAKAINRILLKLEKDGAINEDERFDLVKLRKEVNCLLDSVEPFEVRLKRKK